MFKVDEENQCGAAINFQRYTEKKSLHNNTIFVIVQ